MSDDGITYVPVLGPLVQSVASTLLGGFPWFEFDTGTIHGLAHVNGRRVDLLAVAAHYPGLGFFGDFIEELQHCYDVVGIWEVWSDAVEHTALTRGFRFKGDEQLDREPTQGFLWERAR